MKYGDIKNRLSGKLQLKEAKTNEDLDKPRTSDKVLLTDDQLGSVAGGEDCDLIRPENYPGNALTGGDGPFIIWARCPTCGEILDPRSARYNQGCICAKWGLD